MTKIEEKYHLDCSFIKIVCQWVICYKISVCFILGEFSHSFLMSQTPESHIIEYPIMCYNDIELGHVL